MYNNYEYFSRSDFLIFINFKLNLIYFKLQSSILDQNICNNRAAFAITTNNFQKNPKLLDFSSTKLFKG